MPVKMVVGKNKFGNPKELHIPNKIYDARGNVAWEEWQVKNRYRDSRPVELFDRVGRKGSGSGLILGPNGKPIPPIIRQVFTPQEIRVALRSFRSRSVGKEPKDYGRRLKNAGKTISLLESISKRKDYTEADKVVWGVKLLLGDSFLGTAIMTGKLVVPEVKGLTFAMVKESAQDYFFREYQKEKQNRKDQFELTDKRLKDPMKKIIIGK